MNLMEDYVRYLRNRQDVEALRALIANLEEGGYALEALLLQNYAQRGPATAPMVLKRGVWAGHRAFVGPDLPPPQRAGDIWFDTCELMPMILLPSEHPLPGEAYAPVALARMSSFDSWMAMRAVANWQYGAFMRLAKIGRREVQIPPPIRLLDADRILQGAEIDSVTCLTTSEAALYANWFGKGLCDQDEWQAAARLLAPEAIRTLWGRLEREWAGQFQEGVCTVVSPQTVNLDWMEVWDSQIEMDPGRRIFYGEWDMPTGVGFRTCVSVQLGLLTKAADVPASLDDVELLDILKRNP